MRCCSADATSYPTSITPHVAQIDVHCGRARRRQPSEGCLAAMAQTPREGAIGSRRNPDGPSGWRDRLRSRIKFHANDLGSLPTCVQCNYESIFDAKFARSGMNLRQLRTFVAIADAGGLARAEGRLHLSQPA